MAEQAREFYRASIAAGDSLTGRQLGRMYNRSPSWGRERIGEVKAREHRQPGGPSPMPTSRADRHQRGQADGLAVGDRMLRAA